MINKRYVNDGTAIIDLNEVQIDAKNSLLRKLEEQEYKYESVKCECGSSSFETLAEKDRYGLNVNTVICKSCGLMMINPRMNQESYNLFYDNEYRKLYNGDDKPTNKFFIDQFERGRKIVDFIKHSMKSDYFKINNVLEIGCGAGGILQKFANEGFNVTGIDLGSEYVDFGMKKGLNLLCCSSKELLINEKKKYDLIILSHVLEHFLDLKYELSIMKQLLTPNGVIYIEVPGVKNLQNSYECDFLKYLQNAHTYNFSLNTLIQIMKLNDFQFIKGDEQIRSLFRINNIDTDKNILNYYDENMSYLLDLEDNRDYYIENYKRINNNYISFNNRKAFERTKKKIYEFDDGEVIIYGTGAHTKLLCEYIGECLQIKGIVDNDLERIGRIMYGYRVLNLENEKKNVKLIVISSLSYQEQIYERIKSLQDYGIEIFKIYE